MIFPILKSHWVSENNNSLHSLSGSSVPVLFFDLSYLILTTTLWSGCYYHYHFQDGPPRTQRGRVTCPKSHSWQMIETGFKTTETGFSEPVFLAPIVCCFSKGSLLSVLESRKTIIMIPMTVTPILCTMLCAKWFPYLSRNAQTSSFCNYFCFVEEEIEAQGFRCRGQEFMG